LAEPHRVRTNGSSLSRARAECGAAAKGGRSGLKEPQVTRLVGHDQSVMTSPFAESR
jgi:hypothetical protein